MNLKYKKITKKTIRKFYINKIFKEIIYNANKNLFYFKCLLIKN